MKPRFPWCDIALAPLSGVLAAVPAAALAGLPLWVVLWLVGADEPGRWVSLLTLGAFGLPWVAALYAALGGFLRARARVDDDLLDDMVEDRVVQVADAVEIVTDPPAIYLRLESGESEDRETIVLTGEYVSRLRRTGFFPSTSLRLVQLPRSRAVVGLLPLGDTFEPALLSGTDHRPLELDGQSSERDFSGLRSRADAPP